MWLAHQCHVGDNAWSGSPRPHAASSLFRGTRHRILLESNGRRSVSTILERKPRVKIRVGGSKRSFKTLNEYQQTGMKSLTHSNPQISSVTHQTSIILSPQWHLTCLFVSCTLHLCITAASPHPSCHVDAASRYGRDDLPTLVLRHLQYDKSLTDPACETTRSR